jgi:hypothetical protein
MKTCEGRSLAARVGLPKKVAASIVLVSAAVMMCQSQPQPVSMRKLTAQTSPERVADLLFETILTTCPVPGSTSPAVFFYDDTGLKVGRTGPKTLFEYRGSWTKLYPYPIREADKLNGVQYKGLAVLGAPAVRYVEDRDRAAARHWPPSFQARSELRPSDQIIYNSGAEHSNSVMLALTIVKKNNQWFIGQGWDPDLERAAVDLDTIALHKKSCSVAMSANPLSPESR